MTREQQLKELDAKYSDTLTALQDAVSQAQMQLNDALAQKQQLIDEVNRYYDALDAKEQAEIIIANTSPEIKSPMK